MSTIKTPTWINQQLLTYTKPEHIPDALITEINGNLDRLLSDTPLVSIVMPAWNEEVNIVRTIYSLSKNKCAYPVEIIVINNNSTDGTQNTLNRLHFKSYLQPIQGCGPSRQLGQEKALGKYILMCDADCFYPSGWIQHMTDELKKPGVACVYGRYSFLGTADKARWKLFLYECMRDVIAELRHINRPHLNALGMSMGYVKEFGLAIGFVDRNMRGEDGRMCFDLMQKGKVRQVRARSNRVWTLPRTLDKEGSLFASFMRRVFLEFSRSKSYFKKQEIHDTKTSGNFNPSTNKYFKKYEDNSQK